MKKLLFLVIFVLVIALLLVPNVLAISCSKKIPAPARNQICNGTWSKTLNIDGASPSNVSIQGFGDRLIIAARGVDNKVYVKEIGVMSQSVLVDWYVINDESTTASPKLVVAKSKLSMYIQEIDGYVYSADYQSPGSWSGWVNTSIQNTCFGSGGPFNTKGSDGQLYRTTGNPLELQVCAGTHNLGVVHAPYNGLVAFNTNDSNSITFATNPIGTLNYNTSNGIGNVTSTNYFIIKNNDTVAHQIVFAGYFYWSSTVAICPFSNVLDIQNFDFSNSTDGGNTWSDWHRVVPLNKNKAFSQRGFNSGMLQPGNSIYVKLRVRVPSLCMGTFNLNDNSHYFLLFL